MGAREANRLAELAAELREQVPPQFLPRENATLRNWFAVAESPAAVPDETLEIGTQNSLLEIEPDREPVVNATPEPILAAINERSPEPEPKEPEPEINVVDTPGASDIHEQQQDVSAVHEEADELTRRRALQAQDAIADGKDFENGVNGYQALGPWVNARQGESAEEKRKKEDEKFTRSMLKKILEDRLKALAAQIAAIDERLGEIAQRFEDIERMKHASAQVISDLENGGRVELDQDGKLRNKDAERALQEYERRNNVQVNRDDPQAVLLALRAQQEAFAREQAELNRERTDLDRRRDELEAEAEQTIAAAQADGVITRVEAEKLRRDFAAKEAAISAQARISDGVSDEVKEIAAANNSGAMQEAVAENAEFDIDALNSALENSQPGSLAAKLDGDGSYSNGIQSPVSAREVFAQSANPASEPAKNPDFVVENPAQAPGLTRSA